jgi:hypothetical protein
LMIAEKEGMRRQREAYTRRRKKSGDFGYPRANRAGPG